MGYITLLDFLAGNNDRHSNINFNNWLEERDKKKIHLIDNDPVGSPGSHGFGEGDIPASQRGWLTSARTMFGADAPGGPGLQHFMSNWLGVTSGQPSFPFLFGEGGQAGFAGIAQALGDLPCRARPWRPAFSSRRGPVRSRLNGPRSTRPSWNGLTCCRTC